MAWVMIDDDFAEHPKFLDVGDDGVALWARALAYANKRLTDGFIPRAAVPRLSMSRKPFAVARKLVDARAPGSEHGLWVEVDGGYQIHDFHHFQPSAEAERKRRAEISEKRAAAGRIGAAKRWQTDGTLDVKADGKPMANAMATERQAGCQPDGNRMAPSPIPDQIPPVVPPSGGPATGQASLLPSEPKPAKQPRKVAIPDGWQPKPKAFETGAELGFDAARVRFEADKFRDRAVAEGTKHVQWDAAFANWLRNAHRFDQRDGRAPAAPPSPRPDNQPPLPTAPIAGMKPPPPRWAMREGPAVAQNGPQDAPTTHGTTTGAHGAPLPPSRPSDGGSPWEGFQ